jgi:hypothetical protein
MLSTRKFYSPARHALMVRPFSLNAYSREVIKDK